MSTSTDIIRRIPISRTAIGRQAAEARVDRIERTAELPQEERRKLMREYATDVFNKQKRAWTGTKEYGYNEFARQFGFNKATVQKYLSQGTDPLYCKVDQLEKLAKINLWTVDELIRYFRTGIKPKPEEKLEISPQRIAKEIKRLQAVGDEDTLMQIARLSIKNLPKDKVGDLIELCLLRLKSKKDTRIRQVASNRPIHDQLRSRQEQLGMNHEEFRSFAEAIGVTDEEWEIFWSNDYIDSSLLAKLARLTGLSVDAVASLRDGHPDAPVNENGGANKHGTRNGSK